MRMCFKKLLMSTILLIFISGCVSTVPKPSNQGVSKTKEDKALAYTKLARGYLQKKQYSVAKDELEKALSIDPTHSDSNYVMGLLMMQLEQYDTAEDHFVRAVKSNRENSAAAHDFGMFLCQLGKVRKSIDYFEIAVSNPLFANAELSYMRAGECLAKINDPRAEKYLKSALDANPRLHPALYRLAVIKYNDQEYFSARAYIERYMAITESQPAALFLAYNIESNLNAADVAEKYRLELLEDFPGSDQANRLRRQFRDDVINEQ